MHTSIPLLLAVFVLGFALGALLVAVQRRTRIEKLKQEFQQQLESIVERTETEPSAQGKAAESEPDKAPTNPTRAA